MLHLGVLKGAAKVKLTKLLAVLLFSGTILNIGLMTSNIASNSCKNDGEIEDGTSQSNNLRSLVGVDVQYGVSRSRKMVNMSEKKNATGAPQGFPIPVDPQSPIVLKGVSGAESMSRHQQKSEGDITNAFNHSQRLDEASPHLDKQMISTMHRTVHVAPWGKIDHLCANKTLLPKSAHMLKVSVVITFHNSEKLERLLHTIHSIIQRTPEHLLQEIILIDDRGKREEFREILYNYISSMFWPKVKLKENWLKTGLIGARLAGTRVAKGDIIVCMDSHMEVQDHWLEPLLVEIINNPKTLAASYLDWMEYDMRALRWNYRHGASTWKTYFDWTFTFGFQDISFLAKSRRHSSDPIESPVTIGTIFAIKKDFFREIGEFDDQMVGWGGENLDLPLRTWMFGGRVVNVPCSHAAHYEELGHRNYRVGWDRSISRNYRRVADVWLGNYSQLLLNYKQGMQEVDPGNLASRLELKARSLHNFSWYLANVFPELGVPSEHSLGWGGLQNVGSKFCLYSNLPNPPVIMDCMLKRPEKTGFFWSKTGELRFPLHVFSANRGYSSNALRVGEWIQEFNTTIATKWIHWKNGPLIDMVTRKCLTTFKDTYTVKLVECNFTQIYQQWTFINYTDSYRKISEPIKGAINSRFTKILNQVLQWRAFETWEKINNFVWHRNPT